MSALPLNHVSTLEQGFVECNSKALAKEVRTSHSPDVDLHGATQSDVCQAFTLPPLMFTEWLSWDGWGSMLLCALTAWLWVLRVAGAEAGPQYYRQS